MSAIFYKKKPFDIDKNKVDCYNKCGYCHTFIIDMKNVYNIANFNILIEYKYNYTFKFLEDFLVRDEVKPDFSISLGEKDILKEFSLSEIKIMDVVESSAILRKLANVLLEKYSTVLFHASSIKYDDKAYLFTAPSGTGKSTHTALLKKLLGDKLKYINDDKPFISLNGDVLIVHGSPWRGKHRLGGNVSAPLKAIVKVVRGKENLVKKLDPINSLNLLLEQAYSYDDVEATSKLLDIINIILTKVDFYELYCNMDDDAPKVSFENILKGEHK